MAQSTNQSLQQATNQSLEQATSCSWGDFCAHHVHVLVHWAVQVPAADTATYPVLLNGILPLHLQLCRLLLQVTQLCLQLQGASTAQHSVQDQRELQAKQQSPRSTLWPLYRQQSGETNEAHKPATKPASNPLSPLEQTCKPLTASLALRQPLRSTRAPSPAAAQTPVGTAGSCVR
jgi:hypothetical protein